MGPTQPCSAAANGQARYRFRPRFGLRECLLKGCGCWFVARHHFQRYCSKACAAAYRRWRRWRDQVRYRSSDKGKEARRKQCQRRRERHKTMEMAASQHDPSLARAKAGPDPTCEGHPFVQGPDFFPCDRPGCYVPFRRSPRSPLRRFCSSACRLALRRVRLREARWRRVLKGRVLAVR